MKKRLLLVLAVIALMCACAFSANAGSCPDSPYGIHETAYLRTVKPTCDKEGYDLWKCKYCPELTMKNPAPALGHSWSEDNFVSHGDYYYNERNCSRCEETGVPEADKFGNPIIYYNVLFVNAYHLDSSNKAAMRDNSVSYVYLVDSAKLRNYPKTLQSTYVKAGESVTYNGSKPTRYKDINFGRYYFTGWTEVLDGAAQQGDNLNFNVTIPEVNSNKTYYAAWEGKMEYYNITFFYKDGTPLTNVQKIPHGGTVQYPFSYPPMPSDTMNDYVVAGWQIGTAGTDVYELFDVEDIHITRVPIYSNDGIMVVHEAVPRKYVYTFCDKNWNPMSITNTLTLPYGFNKNSTDAEGATNRELLAALEGEARAFNDNTNYYTFTGEWETENGKIINFNSATVPDGSLDWDDPIYLRYIYADEYVVDGNGEKVEINDFYEIYPTLFSGYQSQTVELVKENGEVLADLKGKAIRLYMDRNGLRAIQNDKEYKFANENEYRDYASSVKNIKLKPVYKEIRIEYPLALRIVIPADEAAPEDYYDGLRVQVTGQNGNLLAAGETKKLNKEGSDKYSTECTLYASKNNLYNISVVSANGKYIATDGFRWDYYFDEIYSYNEKNGLRPGDDGYKKLEMNLILSEDYVANQNKRCNCLCHNSFLRPIWVRVLNLLYSFFGVKYVCCYDMYATIGDLLAYGP